MRTVAESKIHIAAAKRSQLAVTQTAERSDQHQGSEAIRHQLHQVKNLGDGGHRPLGGMLGASTLDPAWIAPDHVIVNGRIEHGTQEPVRLRGHGRGYAVSEQTSTPPTHSCRRDIRQRDHAKLRGDVSSQNGAVHARRSRSQLGPLSDPLLGVLD